MAKTKPITGTYTVTFVKQGGRDIFELRKHSRYDVGDAKTDVWYSLWMLQPTFWRKRLKWRRVQEKVCYESGCYKRPVTGDLTWARRTAKHYKIKVPK